LPRCMEVLEDADLLDAIKRKNFQQKNGAKFIKDGKISDFNFSNDSKFIVSSSADKSIKLWNSEGKIVHNYTIHKAGVYKVKFNKDGRYILSASDDKTARLMPTDINTVFDKINKEKVRGDVYELTKEELKLYGIKD